jgi:hypothetical protein
MNKPKLEHIQKAIEYMGAPFVCTPTEWFMGVYTRINEIALAEQQESEYITAAQARELGAGNAEFNHPTMREEWNVCVETCSYPKSMYGGDYKYRAIKQAQPESVDPHAALRAEYAKQVAAGATGFYLWEFDYLIGPVGFQPLNTRPEFHPSMQYRCTDIICYVSKDGEPAIRMLRTEAQELQRKLGDTVVWNHPNMTIYAGASLGFNVKGTYTYRTRATIKLDGEMVTPEQAAAEWEAKKETHDVYSISTIETTLENYPRFSLTFDSGNGYWYELRPKALKQPAWTGSREDVIALLKEKELL